MKEKIKIWTGLTLGTLILSSGIAFVGWYSPVHSGNTQTWWQWWWDFVIPWESIVQTLFFTLAIVHHFLKDIDQ